MLRKLLEAKVGPLIKAEFAEVMDLTITDIRGNDHYRKINEKGEKPKRYLPEVIEIAVNCHFVLTERIKKTA